MNALPFTAQLVQSVHQNAFYPRDLAPEDRNFPEVRQAPPDSSD
jgi:hypothetical protein